MVAPPNAAAVAPMTVIPIWTVARKRSGCSRSVSAARAAPLPPSTSPRSRVARSAMIAISAPAKNAFARMSAMTMAISLAMSRL
jgi:hypothetical protein